MVTQLVACLGHAGPASLCKGTVAHSRSSLKCDAPEGDLPRHPSQSTHPTGYGRVRIDHAKGHQPGLTLLQQLKVVFLRDKADPMMASTGKHLVQPRSLTRGGSPVSPERGNL